MFAAMNHDEWKVRQTYVPKAKKILRMCGLRMAALYLKNRGYTAEQAVTILLR